MDKTAFSTLAIQAGIGLDISDFGSGNKLLVLYRLAHHSRAALFNKCFDKCTRIEINHSRSSMMILDRGVPVTLTTRRRRARFAVGSTSNLRLAAFASFASKVTGALASSMARE